MDALKKLSNQPVAFKAAFCKLAAGSYVAWSMSRVPLHELTVAAEGTYKESSNLDDKTRTGKISSPRMGRLDLKAVTDLRPSRGRTAATVVPYFGASARSVDAVFFKIGKTTFAFFRAARGATGPTRSYVTVISPRSHRVRHYVFRQGDDLPGP